MEMNNAMTDNKTTKANRVQASLTAGRQGRGPFGMDDTPAEPRDDAEVMQIWRECGFPEDFLGNGGTNHKLVAFAERLRLPVRDEIDRLRALLREAGVATAFMPYDWRARAWGLGV